jgi:hypothetical protein
VTFVTVREADAEATRRLYAVEELKSNSIFFLLSHLVAVHLPELGIIQRLKHILDQIPLSSSFQILAADPCFGCIFSTAMPSAALGPHDPSAPPS